MLSVTYKSRGVEDFVDSYSSGYNLVTSESYLVSKIGNKALSSFKSDVNFIIYDNTVYLRIKPIKNTNIVISVFIPTNKLFIDSSIITKKDSFYNFYDFNYDVMVYEKQITLLISNNSHTLIFFFLNNYL